MTVLRLPPARPFSVVVAAYEDDGNDDCWALAQITGNGREMRVAWAMPIRGQRDWAARVFRVSLC